jgi:hypothetical protein
VIGARVRTLAVCLTLATLAACGRRAPTPPAAVGQASPEFTAASFEALYPAFLVRRSMDRGPKAAYWQKFAGRWVRWSGKLVSFSPNGITIKHLPQTVTFDVSLLMDAYQQGRIRGYRPGDRIVYIGQLESYDDIFRTFYLSHGVIVGRE